MKCTIVAIALSGLGVTAAYPSLSGESFPQAIVEFVHGDPSDHHADPSEHFEALATMLELTSEQRTDIANLLDETAFFADAKVLLERHRVQVDAVHSATFDEALIREASAPVGVAQADAAVSLARLVHDVHALLTDEQLVMVSSLHPNLRQRVQNHIVGFEQSLASWIEANQ